MKARIALALIVIIAGVAVEKSEAQSKSEYLKLEQCVSLIN